MNRIYRLIWSRTANSLIPVAENTSGRGKRSSVRTSGTVGALGGCAPCALRRLCAALAVAYAGQAHALPQGGEVVAGAGAISQSGNGMTVAQSSRNMAINWQSFGIAAGQSVQFQQPSASSVVLNRVVGQDPSQIFGSLSANGQVFISNPNGVLFGAGAQVNVGGLVATTLGLSDEDFMAGNYRLRGGSQASVINQGSLTAADGGYVALLAKQASNEGVISARLGNASLAAGSDVTLNLNNGSLLGLTVNQGAIGALAQNSHLIQAEGGQVLLTAKAADQLVSAVVNNSGVIEARSVQAEDGVIRLLGDTAAGIATNTGTLGAGRVEGAARSLVQAGQIEADTVDLAATYALVQTQNARIDGADIRLDGGRHTYLSGTVDASGSAVKTAGGRITVAGNAITLSGATLDVSGATTDAAGGSLRVGGGAHGKDGDIANAATVMVSGATSLKANGKQGSIVVWSDETTSYFGKAQAGEQGFIEVSSKGTLNLGGTTEVGAGGQILYDPTNIVIDAEAPAAFYIDLADPTPSVGDYHGAQATRLPGGNILVSSSSDDFGGANAGAVYLYDGKTGALISALYGSKADDVVSSDGIAILSNGNYLIRSSNWDNGNAYDAGAITWASGISGVSGVVSAENSLVGSQASDYVGRNGYSWYGYYAHYGITQLSNGNYVVSSPHWDNGSARDAGAITWGSGSAGVHGVISEANSLVGSSADDRVGSWSDWSSSVTTLSNGNYVVSSPNWDNGTVVNAGAVTWANGAEGVRGKISKDNSLVGGANGDQVGYFSGGSNETFRSITPLSNGNYLVSSPYWGSSKGAVTWGSGTEGVRGVVSADNSLVGNTTGDLVGSRWYPGGWSSSSRLENRVTVLSNGNYLVVSNHWDNGAATDAGAVTWGSGTLGVRGVVSDANSLVGSTANDQVGYVSSAYDSSITHLANGNYLVRSYLWDNGTAVDAGAVTWGSGTDGVRGVISSSNSLVGGKAGDQVGNGDITTLNNGNYIVSSPYWDNGAATDAGAVTWGSGTVGARGVVSAENSLVGSSMNDRMGLDDIVVLNNGNYLVRNDRWDNGTAIDAGAVTWGSGTAGVRGVVSAANSLVGSKANDRVGAGGIAVLNNGNYLVRSYLWDNGTVADVGAVTWGSGTEGVRGVVASDNSLVGSTSGDQVGNYGITALSNGNYVVLSSNWDNGTAADAGAVTWGSGTAGVRGVVSADNSLVGSSANDQVGNYGVLPLSNGNYVVRSSNWDNGTVINAGAVTWGSGTAGVRGVVSADNSLVGNTANDQVGISAVVPLSNGNYLVVSSNWDNGTVSNAGAVTWSNGTEGVRGMISADNSLVGSTANDMVGNYGIVSLINGNYLVVSSDWGNKTAANVGAVTWGSGTAGVRGVVSADNSLVGSTANDRVGRYGITMLSNGNYLVTSGSWDNNGAVDAGAVTWGSGTEGVRGVVSADNSLVGSTAYDQIGNYGITALSNGNYLVRSGGWDNKGAVDAGAVTLGSGTAGVRGAISAANSLVGNAAGDRIGSGDGITSLSNGDVLVRNQNFNGGMGAVWLLADPGKMVDAVNASTAASASVSPTVLASAAGPGATVTLQATNNITVNSAVSVAGKLHLIAGDTMTLNAGGTITSTATGDAIVLSSQRFVNHAGSEALKATNGRWLVYSKAPADNTFGGLVSGNNAVWNATYGGNAPSTIASGNRYVFAQQPSVSVTADGLTKVYDGKAFTAPTYAATGLVDAAAYGNVFAQDMLTGALAVDGINVGTYAIGRGSLAGPEGYLFGTYTGANASITPKAVTVTGMTAASRVYDGSDVATLNGGVIDGTVAGETLVFSGQRGQFDSKHVGTDKAVTVTGLTLGDGTGLASNYSVTQPAGLTADITPKAVTVTGMTAASRVYDGSDGATLSGGRIDGTVAGETLVFSGQSGRFDSKHVGTDKVVTVTGLTLGDGSGLASNYSVSQPTGLTADITPKAVTVTGMTAASRAYDGSDAAALNGGVIDGTVAGETLVFSGQRGQFDSKHVGTDKAVTVIGLTLGDGSGLASNYSVSQPTGLTADITPKAVTVTGMTAASRAYDGSDAAALNGGVIDGTVAGETLVFSGQRGQFDSKHVGTDKAVTVTGLTLGDGTGLASNYSVTQPTGLSADITAKALTVAYTAQNKKFDGTTAATVTGTSADIVSGDAVTFSQAAAFASAEPGTAITVNISSVVLGGSDAANYALQNTTATAAADIVALPAPRAAADTAALPAPAAAESDAAYVAAVTSASVSAAVFNPGVSRNVDPGNQPAEHRSQDGDTRSGAAVFAPMAANAERVGRNAPLFAVESGGMQLTTSIPEAE